MRFTVLVLLVFASAIFPAFAQSDLEAGQRSYELCAGCHGFLGQGDRLVGAPRLGGIETWYLKRQIENFEAERRGHAQGDTNGRRMMLMAQAVDNDRELGDLLAWIATLPAPAPSAAEVRPTVEDAQGQSAYALCSACHGADGRGNESVGAPALVSLDEWYLVEQLKLFAEGLRGTDPADTYGAQMRALSTSFDTDDKRQVLAGFVASLRRKSSE